MAPEAGRQGIQGELGAGMAPEAGRQGIPFGRPERVLLDAVTRLEHGTQGELGNHQPLVGGFRIPAQGGPGIPFDAASFPVQAGEGVDRRDIAGLGLGLHGLEPGGQEDFLLRRLILGHIARDQPQNRARDHGKAKRPCEQSSHGADCKRRRAGRGTR